MLWSRQLHIWNPSVIYEQGGGTNNFAFMGGAQRTFQAADAGQPFLIVAGRTLAAIDRPILMIGVWEYRSPESNNDNRILYYENGVLQGINSEGGRDSFPSHSGDINIGNSSESLQSFNSTVFASQTVSKDASFLGMFNHVSFTEAQCRDIFERMVIAEHTITGTVAQQQAALNALSGTTFENVNCAIQIIQATDATDYALTLDNIKFVQNPFLRDIAISYVGPHTLTVTNSNGSNAEEISTPPEVDTAGNEDGSGLIHPGGGTLIIEQSVTISIEVRDASTSNIIIGARVLLQNNGVNLFNGITDSNGIVSFEIAYSSDTPILGRVRKGTNSPRYKTSPINGIITSSGFSTTVFMVTDE